MTFRPIITIAVASVLAAASTGCKKRTYNTAGVRSERPTLADCGKLGAPNNPNPAHCEGPMHFAGEYVFVDDIDTRKHTGTNDPVFSWMGQDWGSPPFVSKLFGTTVLYTPQGNVMPSARTGKPHIIRDLQYLVGDNQVGIRIIPVTVGADNEPGLVTITDGHSKKPVKGSNILDETLRQKHNLKQTDDIFAAAVYMYPGTQTVKIDQLAYHKSQGSIGHMSVYIGGGVSKHSPKGLHGERWESVRYGEPPTLITVSLEGVDQALLNKNLKAWSLLLNELNGGPEFPGDYTFDPVRVNTLQSQTEFARKWISGGDDVANLKSDPTWGTYCAEFANMVLNFGVNIPLTEEYFVKVWAHKNATTRGNERGPEYAKALFRRAKERYLTEVQGGAPTPAQIEAFQFIDKPFSPLWEQLGVSPLSTKPSEGFVVPQDTTTDLAAALVENFAPWPDVGPAVSAMVIAGLADQFKERLGVDAARFMQSSVPVMVAGFVAHAQTLGLKTDADVTKYVSDQLATPGFPGDLAALLQPALNSQAAAMKTASALSVEQSWSNYRKILAPLLKDSRNWTPPLSIAKQKANRTRSIEELDRLIATVRERGDNALAESLEFSKDTSLKTFVRFNAPPSLFFRAANGLKETSPKVKLSIVGTLFAATWVREKKPGEKSVFELEELRQLITPGGAG